MERYSYKVKGAGSVQLSAKLKRKTVPRQKTGNAYIDSQIHWSPPEAKTMTLTHKGQLRRINRFPCPKDL